MPPQAPQDPFAEFVVEDADPFAAFAAHAAPPEAPPEQGTTGMPETIQGVRHGAPAAIRTTSRFAANHPAGIQKLLSVGMTGLGGTLGGVLGSGFGPTGGIVGALTGAAAKGLTPTQANIREWAGRGMGEAPDVAKAAGRAQGIQEYIKSTSGLKVKPSDILERPHGLPAAEKYAQSQGRDILKILGPDGNVVAGPTTPTTPPKAPRAGGRLLTGAKHGAGAVARGLSALSGPVGITDLAQTIEPTRRDIGVMGIGKSVDVPGMHPTAFAQLRAAILAKLGLP